MPRSRRLAPPALLAVLAAAGLAACGNSRTPVPGPGAPAPSGGLRSLYLVGPGIIVHVPRDWAVSQTPAPLLATISSGSAVIAVWAYPRQAAPPASPVALHRAARALLAAARARDPRLQPIRTAAITVSGRPAVELDALEQVNGRLRRVRSVHVYAPGREVVLDAYAPPAGFHPIDHAVFSPVKRSLRLLG